MNIGNLANLLVIIFFSLITFYGLLLYAVGEILLRKWHPDVVIVVVTDGLLALN